MKLPIFLTAILVLTEANSVSINNDRKGTQLIKPASQRLSSPLLKRTPRNRPLTDFNGTPKEVPGCGISAVSEGDARIFGGQDAIQNEFPWQAIVVIRNPDGLYWGGGSLISQDWALTQGTLSYRGISGWVELGSQHRGSTDEGQVNIDLAEIITHPQYAGEDQNDIALIRFVSSAPYTVAIRPICLPRYSDFVGGGVPLIISGWGSTANGFPDILQKAAVFSMTTADCTATGLQNIDNTKICTTAPPGTGACSGDTGGPLSLVSEGKTYSVGTFSYYGTCDNVIPDVFTRTTAYLSWISSITGIAIDP